MNKDKNKIYKIIIIIMRKLTKRCLSNNNETLFLIIYFFQSYLTSIDFNNNNNNESSVIFIKRFYKETKGHQDRRKSIPDNKDCQRFWCDIGFKEKNTKMLNR